MVRRVNDAYYTLQADAAIDALLKYVPVRGIVLEPCVGEGHLVKALQRRASKGRQIVATTNDIDLTVAADMHGPAQKVGVIGRPWSWVITNPPFSEAFPILKHLLPTARDGVAFLLRLTFLEPTFERGEWLADHPPDLVIVLPRMSFTGDGKTDSVTCAWMVWYRNPSATLAYPSGVRVYPKEK